MNIPILYTLIIVFGAVNLIRMAFFLIASDIYGVKHTIAKKRKIRKLPFISVVIPAHNEGTTVLRSIESTLANDYPKDKMEVIVVDDGSKDNTPNIVKDYIK